MSIINLLSIGSWVGVKILEAWTETNTEGQQDKWQEKFLNKDNLPKMT